MKLLMCCLIVSACMAGCVVGSNEPHADSPAATKRDEGPALCRDGTVPPCNERGAP